MNDIYRVRTEQILADLEKKMVFVVGPRQVGKTYLSKRIAERFDDVVYLNYDNIDHREVIQKMQWKKSADLLILDELHKMADWKNFLKGVYDTKPENMRILVTGSARLEAYRKLGDSLAGRFLVHHLMPLAPSELRGTEHVKDVDYFLRRGGFPEPFLADSDIDAKRWRSGYIDSLIKGDVFAMEQISNVNLIENIFEILRRKVGSPISYSSIARDVASSPATVKKYIEILESLYVVFVVRTYSSKIVRSIQKETKIYFFDTPLVVGDDGVVFENFVAVCLLKRQLQRNDLLGEKNQLMYLRDKEQREVDFVLVKDSEAEKIIEVKLSDNAVSKNLAYFKNKYHLDAMQIVKNISVEKEVNGIAVVDAERYLESL